jgi:hypothetical protein
MLACLSMHTLLPNLLRGIYSRYSTAADIIAGTAGMTFSTVLDQLKLKELRLENEVKVEATNALVASSSGCSGSDCRSSSSKPPQQQPQQGNDGGGNSGDGQQRRKKGNGGRRNDDGNDPRFRPPPHLLTCGFALIHRPYRGRWAAATMAVDSGAAVRGSLVPHRRPTPPSRGPPPCSIRLA